MRQLHGTSSCQAILQLGPSMEDECTGRSSLVRSYLRESLRHNSP